MAPANVKLSNAELLLVCDEQFILTKNVIIEKVYQLFGALSQQFTNIQKNSTAVFPAAALTISPKIYKGEQYKGMPYVLLDCPRLFIKDDAFAIRCVFWWGNFFSITLHVAGKYAAIYAPPVLQALQQNKNGQWHICVNEDQWEHHFNADNYLPVDKDLLAALNKRGVSQKGFIKIAKKIPLQQWDDANEFFVNAFQEIIEMLGVAKT